MPSRRKPTSTRQKKADQQLKRAIKRGDAPPPPATTKKQHHRNPRIGPTGQPIGQSNPAAVESTRKLQSAFVKLSQSYLEETRNLASNLPLPRPIPQTSAIYHQLDQPDNGVLTCPKRPKWRFDMTKNEVEKNEEGLYKKWIASTDQIVENWKQQGSKDTDPDSNNFPQSTSYFERNLEVWRQLWRVTEISQIILVLLDSRCPLLHYPPSLMAYLADRKVILVLTKVDITGPIRVGAWIKYLHRHLPGFPIVEVESYKEKEAGSEHQGQKHWEPSIPDHFRARLVEVIKEVHKEMLEPPERVKTNPKWLSTWTPSVKRDINWESVLNAKGDKTGTTVGGAAVPRPRSPDDGDLNREDGEQRQEPEYLTIGLIGQPNVGKSSLLNALFGVRKVRASKTQGKTKHFQTLYWTSDVRLVDCPGLVMPNLVPMELQVLCGILPISHVSAVPACVWYASQLLPLEKIYNLVHPGSASSVPLDKRTWRAGMRPEETKSAEPLPWTAMDILTAYAQSKGWVTAKAGRPDVHRAGNAILRGLAEGRVGWAFWPPDTPINQLSVDVEEEHGMWIPHDGPLSDQDQEETDGEESPEDEQWHIPNDSEADVESDGEADGEVVITSVGRFGALAIGGDDDDSDQRSSEED